MIAILWIVAALIVLAIGAIIAVAIRKDRARRKRLAAAYDRWKVEPPQHFNCRSVVRPIPPAPIPRRSRAREPETAADEWPRPAPTPTFCPDLFNIPSPLDPAPAPSDWSAPPDPDPGPAPFEPGGGEFGGAGASGSWDDPGRSDS